MLFRLCCLFAWESPSHMFCLCVSSTFPGLSGFHHEPSPQTVPIGGAARFECQIEGVPTPTITWERDRVAVPEETRSALYTVVVADDAFVFCDLLMRNIDVTYIYFKPSQHKGTLPILLTQRSWLCWLSALLLRLYYCYCINLKGSEFVIIRGNPKTQR